MTEGLVPNVERALGQHDARLDALDGRADRHDAAMVALRADFGVAFECVKTDFNARFNGVKAHLDKQDENNAAAAEKTLAKFATVAAGQQEIKDILLAKKVRGSVILWLLARFEFVAGIGAGIAGAFISGRHN